MVLSSVRKLWVLVTFGLSLIAAMPTTAAEKSPLLWMDNSLTLLVGTGFELPGENVSTLTFEHASGWSWGDLFIFTDFQDLHNNPNADFSWYGEFSPRISLGKIAGLKMPEGSLITDLSVAGTFERGKNGVESLLIGIGTDVSVKGFQFVKLNAYARKDTSKGAGFEDVQLTLTWSKLFEAGKQRIKFDGFVDYVIGWGPQASAWHIVPQIKWDLGNTWGKPGKLYLGTEIDIWSNQFGVKNSTSLDTHQVAWNLILKAHF